MYWSSCAHSQSVLVFLYTVTGVVTPRSRRQGSPVEGERSQEFLPIKGLLWRRTQNFQLTSRQYVAPCFPPSPSVKNWFVQDFLIVAPFGELPFRV